MQRSPCWRRRVVLAVCLFHLAAIALCAFTSVFSRRLSPSEQPAPSRLYAAVKLYTLYTALHADYSFFSPEIGSAHRLDVEVIDADGVHALKLAPANREVEVRFCTLLLIFTYDRVYQELMARSIAATAHKEFPAAQRIVVSVHRYNLPPIARYQAGERPTETLLFRGVYEPDAAPER